MMKPLFLQPPSFDGFDGGCSEDVRSLHGLEGFYMAVLADDGVEDDHGIPVRSTGVGWINFRLAICHPLRKQALGRVQYHFTRIGPGDPFRAGFRGSCGSQMIHTFV